MWATCPTFPQSKGCAYTPRSHFGLLLSGHESPSSWHRSPTKSADLKGKRSIKRWCGNWSRSMAGRKMDFPHSIATPVDRNDFSPVSETSVPLFLAHLTRGIHPYLFLYLHWEVPLQLIQPNPDFGDYDPNPLINIWLLSVVRGLAFLTVHPPPSPKGPDICPPRPESALESAGSCMWEAHRWSRPQLPPGHPCFYC